MHSVAGVGNHVHRVGLRPRVGIELRFEVQENSSLGFGFQIPDNLVTIDRSNALERGLLPAFQKQLSIVPKPLSQSHPFSKSNAKAKYAEVGGKAPERHARDALQQFEPVVRTFFADRLKRESFSRRDGAEKREKERRKLAGGAGLGAALAFCFSLSNRPAARLTCVQCFWDSFPDGIFLATKDKTSESRWSVHAVSCGFLQKTIGRCQIEETLGSDCWIKNHRERRCAASVANHSPLA